eukprot:8175712-Karenia_brevis.AAC.1
MSEMLEDAGLEMYQPAPEKVQQISPDRPGNNTGSSRHKDWGIRLSDQEWLPGPKGQMSLGDMLQSAGYEVTRTDEE